MKQIYLTESLLEAELVRSFLRQRGIDAHLENEFSWNVAMPPAALPLILAVSEEDEPEALDVIRDYLSRNDLQP